MSTFTMSSGNERIASTVTEHESEASRQAWSSRMEFLLSCLGNCVGLGNIWRFPYIAYKNGGGSFLIPYLVCTAIIGYPIVLMEVALGQFTRCGAVAAWDIFPVFKGLGYCMMLYAALQVTYCAVVMSWIIYYFVASFSSPLPWMSCNNSWNTARCKVQCALSDPGGLRPTFNDSTATIFSTAVYKANSTTETSVHSVLPAREFWRRGVLQMTDGVDDLGEVRWSLLLCLAVISVLAYLCVFKGIAWSGKMVYVTVTLPYVLMLALLISAAQKEGATAGVLYFICPSLDKLPEPQIWLDAASQVLFSCAVTLTVLPAFGCYCPRNNNCYRDVALVVIVNFLTSLLFGFTVFTMIGQMAHAQKVPIENVTTSGPGLVLVTYPQGISLLPCPQFWSVIFFLMMLLVNLDSQFCMLEGLMATLVDVFPQCQRWRMLVLFGIVSVSFLFGIPFITQGGMYLFQLEDYYIFGAYVAQIIALLEVVGVSWGYGVNRFYNDIESMVGCKLPCWLKVCWVAVTPLVLVILPMVNILNYQPLTYNAYVFPSWANQLAMVLSALVLLVVPVYAVVVVIQDPGHTFRERLRNVTRPKLEQCSTTENETQTENSSLIH